MKITRDIINISLPTQMAKKVRADAKISGYASVSEYIRNIIRERDSTALAEELAKQRADFNRGRSKKLHSLRDLQ